MIPRSIARQTRCRHCGGRIVFGTYDNYCCECFRDHESYWWVLAAFLASVALAFVLLWILQ